MALEQTPPEPALRHPRRRSRELTSLLWLCGWGGVTAVALAALTSQTQTASERLRYIFASSESSAIARMPPRVAQLESETQILAGQVHALTTDRDRLAGRIALLESTIDDMTGTIKKQAAATAAALAARANPPTSNAPATAPAPSPNPRPQIRRSPQRLWRQLQLRPSLRPRPRPTRRPRRRPPCRRPVLRPRPQKSPTRRLRTKTNSGWISAVAARSRLCANVGQR